jgi:hypothetical protein
MRQALHRCALAHRQEGDKWPPCAQHHQKMQRSYGYVIDVSSQLTQPSTSTPVGPATRARRARTISLETQSAYKVGLAVVIGAAVIAVRNPIGFAALLMLAAAFIAGYALNVLAADPRSARTLRVRDHAHTDGATAAVLAVLAIAAAAAGADNAAVIAAGSAIVLAAMRLRTRYAA